MSNPTPSRSLALPLLFGAQLAVGAAAIFARYALEGAQPIAVAALRMCIAGSILVGIGLIRGRSRAHSAMRAGQRGLLAIAGVMLAIHFAAWIWSLQYTTVAVSTLIVATTPLFTTLYDLVILKRRVSPFVWLAYVAAALGLYLVVGFAGATVPIPEHVLLGDGLALAGSIAIGAYFIIVREVRSELSTRAIVSNTYVSAAVVLVAAAVLMRQTPPPLQAHSAWFGIVAMALISQLLGHTALNASLRFFSPSAIATATLLEPVFAAILASLIFAENMSALAIAGGIVLLGAIALALRFERPIMDQSIS